MPNRVQRQRTAGWRAPEGAVYVGRPSKWANLWRIVPVCDASFPWGDAADVIHAETGNSIGRFDRVSRGPGRGAPYWSCHAFRRDLTDELIEDARQELAGHDLMCWCGLDQPYCHADIWIELSNAAVML
jgi:hypothetical protein